MKRIPSGFDFASVEEIRAADLFFEDLVGLSGGALRKRHSRLRGRRGEADERSGEPLVESTRAEDQASALRALSPLIGTATRPTVDNARRILKALCLYHDMPWRVGFVVLEHEGGVRLLRHADGVMQTTHGARQHRIPRIPRELKLALLGLPSTSSLTVAQLNARIRRQFRTQLAIQIAVGVQELADDLGAFSGYVALAMIAYNAGAGWAYHIVNGGRSRRRPTGVNAHDWEELCRAGAHLLHQRAGNSPLPIRVNDGWYQCDSNIPSWFRAFGVRVRASNLSLPAYQYLRRIRARIRANRPTTPCNATTHRHREPGTGGWIQIDTRWGALDKLYDPARLSAPYRPVVASSMPAIQDDGLPLRVHDGRLFKVPLPCVNGPIAPHMREVDPMAAPMVRNELYAPYLGWHARRTEIHTLLGFSASCPTPQALVTAVRRWQRRARLPATGDIDDRTWRRMQRRLPPVPYIPTDI